MISIGFQIDYELNSKNHPKKVIKHFGFFRFFFGFFFWIVFSIFFSIFFLDFFRFQLDFNWIFF